MLHTAVVPVDRRPVFERLFRGERLVVVRVHIAQEIPGRACPLGHGVSLSLGRAAAARAGRVDPVGHVRERGFAVVGRLIGVHIGQLKRQLVLRDRYIAALVAVYDRDGLAPVALAGEHPVAQLILHLGTADALLLEPFDHGRDRVLDRLAV